MIEFPCGCKISESGIDYNNLPNCQHTWDTICDGDTKGIFQLESGLGKSWAIRVKPRSIEELSDLVAIIRPGVLESKIEDKSLTQHYTDRKHGKEQISYLHESLRPILNKTYGILIYQEQALLIAKDIAGYTLSEADVLRKCIAKGSVVYTNRGPKRIEDVKTGKILSLDENNKLYFSKLKDVWSSGKQRVFKVSTNNGYQIDLTKNHEMFTNRGWIKVKDLTTNDFVVIPKEYHYGGQNDLNDREIMLISYILSEGYHVKKSTTIYNKNKRILDEIKNNLYILFGLNSYSVYNNKNNVQSIKLKGIAKKWADKNINHALSRYKKIPNKILNSTKNKTRLFIAAFFEAEGHVSKINVEISSTSKSVLLDIQALLLRDSIFTSITTKTGEYKNKEYISYRLYISSQKSLSRFYNLYSKFGLTSKFNKIKSILKNSISNDKFIIPNNFVKTCFGQYNLSELIGQPNCTGTIYNSNLSVDKARHINSYIGSDLIQEILDSDYYFVKVKSIEENGFVETYDFETEDNSHCGFINGILVHNSIGKKDVDLMSKQKSLFAEGCKKKGVVDEKTAEEIFDWIEKSQRYSFNKSHSVSYAIIGYQTAYAKTHFPTEFLCSSLRHAHDKINPKQEISELIHDCKKHSISINPPYLKNISEKRKSFHIIDGSIYFGLNDITKFRSDDFNRIQENMLTVNKNHDTMSWEEVLFKVLLGERKISSSSVEGLISCGGLDYLSVERQRMLYEYKIASSLTKKEKEWLDSVGGSLLERMKIAINSYSEYLKDKKDKSKKSLSSQNRMNKIESLVKLLENPPVELVDYNEVFLLKEKYYLKVPVTTSILDKYNTSIGNCTCSMYNSGFDSEEIKISGIIIRCNTYIIKTGKNIGKEMAFVTIEDDTGTVDCVVFSKEYDYLKKELYENNALCFIGGRSYDGKSFQITKTKKI